MAQATQQQIDGIDPAEAFERINAEARRVAGGPGDMPQRVALLHAIFRDSGGNHCFPEVALHGALWAYGFYERRGTVNRMIDYRYFYDREERARRSYMLFEFAQGFKQANRSVFIDTYTNYYFTQALRRSRCRSRDPAGRAARRAQSCPPRSTRRSACCRAPSAAGSSKRR